MLDHVQGQHGVTRCSNLVEGLSQVGLHQASARAVELLERPPGDIHAQNVIAAPLQGFQRDSPAAAGVENLRRGMNPQATKQIQRERRARPPPGMAVDQIGQIDENLLGHALVGGTLRPAFDHDWTAPV